MLTYENASIGDYTSNHNTSWALVRSNSNASIGDYTSNHNKVGYFVICLSNASIGDYTSNHNDAVKTLCALQMRLLAIIHQTTTLGFVNV